MRKYLYLVLIALLAFTGVSFAQQFTVTGFEIDNDGSLTITSTTGNPVTLTGLTVSNTGVVNARRSVEVVTTSDTLTAAESGKLLVYMNTLNSMFTLPAASTAGLEYTFTDGSDTASQLSASVTIDTVAGDFIQYLESMVSGDSLMTPSSPTTGDSVTLTSGGSTFWFVPNMSGTWRDGN